MVDDLSHIAPTKSALDLILESDSSLNRVYQETFARFQKAGEESTRGYEEATRLTAKDLAIMVY